MDIEIAGSILSAKVRTHGAEPVSLHHEVAGEMLWQAGPAWPKHAPVLFPIVGELAGGRYVHDGVTYHMGRHGFARDREFAVVSSSPDACTLVLEDDDATRAMYPYAFAFAIRYAIEDDVFVATYTVTSRDTAPLPASFGAHPAFRWPLREGVPKSAHTITFECDEPQPVRRLAHNLLDPQPVPTPVRGCELPLDPALFANDALIFDRLASTSVQFHAAEGPHIIVSWSGFEQLGLWSNGGDFLCIEPWRGYASPGDFSGDLPDKPGIALVAPGASLQCTMRVRVVR